MNPAVSAPLRVCLLSQEYPTERTVGGIATFNYQLATGLANAGHDVTVIAEAADPRATPTPYTDRGVTVVPVVPRRITWREHLGGWNLLFRSVAFAAAARRAFGKRHFCTRFDVVEGQDAHGHLCLIQRGFRVPTVSRLHTPAAMTWTLNQITPDSGVAWVWQLERSTLLRSHTLVSVSHSLAGRLAADLGIDRRDVAVIHNAVDLDTYSPMPSALSSTPVVLFAGRLERRKGPDVLLECAPRVLAKHPTARFVFVGADAGMGPSLEARAERLGIAQAVELVGGVSPAKMVDAYRHAWVCALPSTVWENFSMVGLEALACGCPVVATDVGGFPEMIRAGETGVLVPPGDVDRTASAILEILAAPERRRAMADAARRAAERCFGRRRLVEETVALYRATCEAARG